MSVADACWLSVAAFGSANAADEEVRTFEVGPGWFVYDEAVDVALHILHPAAPKCHEIGEINLLFENCEQLRDDALTLVFMSGRREIAVSPVRFAQPRDHAASKPTCRAIDTL